MAYLDEFRTGWRPVLGVAFGMGAGLGLISYVTSVFVPALSAEFGWTTAQLALVGAAALIATLGVIVTGRLADTFGVRRVAIVGVVGMPLIYLGFSRMSGDIREYYLLFALLMIIGTTTSTVVYSRVVAERFFTARGLALAIAICGGPATGALAAPMLSTLIATEGWRTAYVALAALSAGFGAIALLLLPRDNALKLGGFGPRLLASRAVYGVILRTPRLWIIIGAMVACNLPGLMIALQLKPLLLDLGVVANLAPLLVSVYAGGVIAGRFLCGVALDTLPTHLVAALGMGLPAIGFAVMATTPEAVTLLAIAVALIGLSQGAEGDISAYLVARHFGLNVYGTVLGLVLATMGAAAAIGGLLLSATLTATGSYATFLAISAGTVAVGSLGFLLLGRYRSAPAIG
ncbi:MAG: MFS transporter [Alphaproteobacteria bacterium]|nr:MFS transporter [Alphaproteobacteria bacterium]